MVEKPTEALWDRIMGRRVKELNQAYMSNEISIEDIRRLAGAYEFMKLRQQMDVSKSESHGQAIELGKMHPGETYYSAKVAYTWLERHGRELVSQTTNVVTGDSLVDEERARESLEEMVQREQKMISDHKYGPFAYSANHSGADFPSFS